MAFIFTMAANNPGAGAYGDGTATTNLTPATSGEAIFKLKELLKTAGWVVQRSGDGTNFQSSAGNANDVITTAAEMNTSTAWFIILDPSGKRMLMFQKGASTGQWKVGYIYPVAGAAQTLSSGSATVASTPSTGAEVLKGTGAYPYTQAAWFSGTDGTYRCSIGADNAAPYGFYVACWTTSTASTLTSGGAFFFDPMLSGSYPSEDVDPVVLYCPQTTSQSDSPWLAVSLSSEAVAASDDNPVKGYLRKELTGGAWVSISAMQLCTANPSIVFPAGAGSNPHNLKDDGVPIVYARLGTLPTPCGYKGVSSFIRWVSANRATGQALTVSSTRDRVVVGHVSLPWDGSTPTI